MIITALYKEGMGQPRSNVPLDILGRLIDNNADLMEYLQKVYNSEKAINLRNRSQKMWEVREDLNKYIKEQRQNGIQLNKIDIDKKKFELISEKRINSNFPALFRYKKDVERNIILKNENRGTPGYGTKSWINFTAEAAFVIADKIFKDEESIETSRYLRKKSQKYITDEYKQIILESFNYNSFMASCFNALNNIVSQDKYAGEMIENPNVQGDFSLVKATTFWDALKTEREFGGKDRGFFTGVNLLLSGQDQFSTKDLRKLVKSTYWANKIIDPNRPIIDARANMKQLNDFSNPEEIKNSFKGISSQSIIPREYALVKLLQEGIPFMYLSDIIRSVPMGQLKLQYCKDFLNTIKIMKEQNPEYLDIITRLNDSQEYNQMFNDFYLTLINTKQLIESKQQAALQYFKPDNKDIQEIVNIFGPLLNKFNNAIKKLQQSKICLEKLPNINEDVPKETVKSGFNVIPYCKSMVKLIKEKVLPKLNDLSINLKTYIVNLNAETQEEQSMSELNIIDISDVEASIFINIVGDIKGTILILLSNPINNTENVETPNKEKIEEPIEITENPIDIQQNQNSNEGNNNEQFESIKK